MIIQGKIQTLLDLYSFFEPVQESLDDKDFCKAEFSRYELQALFVALGNYKKLCDEVIKGSELTENEKNLLEISKKFMEKIDFKLSVLATKEAQIG